MKRIFLVRRGMISILLLVLATIVSAVFSPEELAALGHPMYQAASPADADHRQEEKDRMLQSGCQFSMVYVNYSEYVVDWMGGQDQYGVCPLYLNGDYQNAVGKWWWSWAYSGDMTQGTYRSYGSMMIEYNPQESIVFGFSNTQTNWPITGGYLLSNSCPAGFSLNDAQVGDIKSFGLYICPGGCTGKTANSI